MNWRLEMGGVDKIIPIQMRAIIFFNIVFRAVTSTCKGGRSTRASEGVQGIHST